MRAAILEARNCRIAFGGVRALDDVTLSVPERSLTGVVGPNGSGKSTLLGALSRLIDLDSGVIEFTGVDCTTASAPQIARRGMARTFQTVRLLPDLTVVENVMLGADISCAGVNLLSTWLRPRRAREAEAKAKAAAMLALERVGLADHAERFPGTLPYGTQRGVEIARAIVAEPSLLLLDEPTAGMARVERDAMGRVFTGLRDGGMSLVLVEHDLPLITAICDTLYVLNFGKVIAEGDPRECVRRAEVQEAYLGRRRDAA